MQRSRSFIVVLAILLVGCATSPGRVAGPSAASAAASAAESARAIAKQGEPLVPAATQVPATPSPVPATPTLEPEPFAMNLYSEGDFVPQHTFEWCVAASIQMTWNMARDPNRSSAEDQGAVWEEARARSNDRWNGASGIGWATLLTEWGVGEYVLAATRDYEKALRMAARAMRNNELAVGLIMWRGRHAWVMSGFESIGDPAIDEDFIVTGIRVLDPLYPYGDGTWGPSPAPNTLMTPEELAVQFKPRENRSGWSPDSPPGYVLVLPVEPQA